MLVWLAMDSVTSSGALGVPTVIQTYIVQWNLRTRDTFGVIVLSFVERLSLSRRVFYQSFHCIVGVQ